MRVILFWTLSLLLVLTLAWGQLESPPIWPERRRLPKLPSGRSPEQMIVKAHLKDNLEDLDELLTLTAELEQILESNESTERAEELRRRTDRIEKLAKAVGSRLRWF